MKRLLMLLAVALVFGGAAGMAWAEDGAEDKGGEPAPAKTQADIPMAKALAIIGPCLGAGLAAVGGGLGIARVGGACVEAIARQPEAAGAVFAPMIVTAAMIEGGMLFAMVVCLLGLYLI